MRSTFRWCLSALAAGTIGANAHGEVRYTFEYAASLASLSVPISNADLINGLLPLRNPELAAGYPFNTNGYVPCHNMGDPCAPSPLNNPNTGHSGFHPASPQQNGAALTDGIAGTQVDTVLADFLWPAAVVQYNFAGPTDIGEIRVFASNIDRDGRVFQNYDVAVSTDANPDAKERVFAPLIERVIATTIVCAGPGSGDGFAPNVNDGTQVPAIEATLTRVYDDASATLATNITSIRLTFWAVSNTQRTFRDQWLGPIGCMALTPEQLDIKDQDGFARAFESPVIKEIDVLAARTVVPEICDNALDDDGDTLVDGADPDCFGQSCPPENCTNAVDDNGNSLIDCADPDCLADAACNPEICDNQTDDDGDELVDCQDPDCDADPACLCNDPVFDLDDDTDVDLDDFAGFQLCYTGPTGGPPQGACACLDLNDDGRIAEEDFARFMSCASQAFVAANDACDD